MKSGDLLITEKRISQVLKGFNYEHDSTHEVRDFLDAAYTYMYVKPDAWPFSDGLKWGSEIENLTNAGAMIAAAIDLIQGNKDGPAVDIEVDSPEKEKINNLERIIEYAADDLGVSVSYLKKVGIEWYKDDPLTNPDFEDRNV